MGQTQSESIHAGDNDNVKENSSTAATNQSSSMEALLAEATVMSDGDENESLDVKAQKALECPCVAELRDGPCGKEFTEAFICFIKSTAEEKGSDCVHPFVAFQNCIQSNPNAFAKYDLDDRDSTDGENAQEGKP